MAAIPKNRIESIDVNKINVIIIKRITIFKLNNQNNEVYIIFDKSNIKFNINI